MVDRNNSNNATELLPTEAERPRPTIGLQRQAADILEAKETPEQHAARIQLKHKATDAIQHRRIYARTTR